MKMNKKIKIFFTILSILLIPTVIHAADLDIICNENNSPTIIRNLNPLFTLSGFAPGDTESRNIYIQNNDPNNSCTISLEGRGNDNTLTDKLRVLLDSTDIFSLSEFLNGGNILIASVNSNSNITKSLSISFPSDSDNTYANKNVNFDILINSQWGSEQDSDEQEDDIGDIGGVGDANLPTNTTSTPENGLVSNSSNDNEQQTDDTKPEEEQDDEILGEATDINQCIKKYWWIPTLLQILLTITVISINKNPFTQKVVKILTGIVLGILAYILTKIIGCGCNLIWICEHIYILNIVLSLIPFTTLLFSNKEE